ncbi:hypothetical protein WSM22_35950 [Cytophagales bacterium WSM2-2]|nr:hypothetical protein WSM22_35950 [Cytophagales bacterium WSM2-2]
MIKPLHRILFMLVICVSWLLSQNVNAQNYTLASTADVFTPLTGSTPVDEIEDDDVISNTIPIGFTFNYYGQAYTQLKASSNGFISFDPAASSNNSNNIGSSSSLKVIAPLWDDLGGLTTGAASYNVTGTAPNQIFTFEWLNWKWGFSAPAAVISFQVKLYEGSNTIEFIYRQEAGAVTNGISGASIGLVGNSSSQFYSLANSTNTPTLDPDGKNDILVRPATGQHYTFTASAAPIAPTSQATNVIFSNVTGTTATISWTNGNGTLRQVFMKRTTSTSETVAPTDGNIYHSSTTFGNVAGVGASNWFSVFNGTGNTVNVTNLEPGYTYRAQVVEYNGLGGGQKYNSTSAANNPVNTVSTLSTPTNPVSTLSISDQTTTSIAVNHTDGNGTSIAIFIKAGNSGISAPVNNTTYTANAVFGNGSQIGTTGWFCIFNGERHTGATNVFTVTATGLTPNTDYRVHVVDYNGPAGSELYNAASVVDNPIQLTTFSDFPVPAYTFAASAGTFTPLVGANAVDVIEDDDVVSDPIPIGFPFRFASMPVSKLRASSNGFVTFNLISNVHFDTQSNGNSLKLSNYRPLAAPLWDDLHGTGGQASYQTTGIAPNRIFTMEWLNWKWNYQAAAANISMQVKLYEADNHIEYIYRQEAGALSVPTASIGLAFLGINGGNFLSLNNTTASPSVSSTIENTDLNVRPANGQVYSFTPAKVNQTITFNTLPGKSVGDAPFTLTASATSGLPVTYTSSNTAVATVSGNTVTVIALGTADITASQSGDKDFAAATSVVRTLTVGQVQTITFNTLPVKTFGDAGFTLTGTASSGLSVAYASSNTAVATISGNVVTIVGGGTTDITASQAGNGTYLPAPAVVRTLTVNKANQTITFGTIPTKTFGDPNFALTATSTSGLTISYTTANDNVLISGNQVGIVKPGQLTINANQAGNSNYNAATQVSQTFCINPAKPSFAFTGLNTDALILTSSSTTGNQWFNNGVAINGATNATFTVNGAGVYTVVVSAGPCSSVPSDGKTFTVTGVEEELPSEAVTVYPNPVGNQLVVDITGLNSSQPVSLSLYDISGRVVHSVTIENKVSIDVAAYGTGVYILKLQDGKRSIVRKIIKK